MLLKSLPFPSFIRIYFTIRILLSGLLEHWFSNVMYDIGVLATVIWQWKLASPRLGYVTLCRAALLLVLETLVSGDGHLRRRLHDAIITFHLSCKSTNNYLKLNYESDCSWSNRIHYRINHFSNEVVIGLLFCEGTEMHTNARILNAILYKKVTFPIF